MAEAAAAGNGDPFPGPRLSLLDALVRGDARADQRRRFLGAEALGDMSHVIGVGQKVFGEAAVLGVAAELGLVADRLPGRQAVFAVSASRIKPGHADPVAFLDERNAGADPNHDAYRLVTRDKGRRRLQRPVAVGGMQICVTDAAGLSLDQDLAGPGRGDIPLLQLQRLLERRDDSGLHLGGHSDPPSGFEFRRKIASIGKSGGG